MIPGNCCTKQKTTVDTRLLDFFVANKLPFVGNNYTFTIPFVENNAPFMRNVGFTIVELVITLLIVAIMTAVAIPQMRALFQNNRLTTQANSLISDITLAKDFAKGRGIVVICTSSNGTTCDTSGWGSGRLIFADAAPNDFTYTAATDRLLRYTDPLPAGSIEVTLTTFPDPLIFSTQGSLVNTFQQRLMALATAPGAGASINLMICDVNRAVPGRTIEIRTNGTPAISTVPAVCP